jgi:hypothetical protein
MTYKVTDINGITGAQVVRDMTDAELEQQELDIAAAKTQAKVAADKAKAKAALLEKLGISADEAALLLG